MRWNLCFAWRVNLLSLKYSIADQLTTVDGWWWFLFCAKHRLESTAWKRHLHTTCNFKIVFPPHMPRLQRRRRPVWPDVGIKIVPAFPKVAPKVAKHSFYLQIRFFKMAKKSPNIWATLASKFDAENFKKIVQSCHTGYDLQTDHRVQNVGFNLDRASALTLAVDQSSSFSRYFHFEM